VTRVWLIYGTRLQVWVAKTKDALRQSSDQEKSSVSFLPNSTSCGYGRPTLRDVVGDLHIVGDVAPYYALVQVSVGNNFHLSVP
jgi:hypothetical protein